MNKKRSQTSAKNNSQLTNLDSDSPESTCPAANAKSPATYNVKEEETSASAFACDAKYTKDLPEAIADAGIQRQLARMRKEALFLAKLDRENAERQRRRIQNAIDTMAQTTSKARISAAKARAALTHAKINETAANASPSSQSTEFHEFKRIRIDDLQELFASREILPARLGDRIKKVYAKTNWKTQKGKAGYFNDAVHKNNIPIDIALTILAHINSAHDGSGKPLDEWVDAVIECGLFPRISRGKFEYGRRCQDGDACELCNYVNISDGLKTLFAAYDASAFIRGGNWFAITVAPRLEGCGRAVGRLLNQEDWNPENPESIVFREQYHGRVFRYLDYFDYDELGDFLAESGIRRFLGAGQFVFGKVVKNGWLDGIRARVENSIEFLPYTSHQHWHAVGSSLSSHDPQGMASFMKDETDEVLEKTWPDLEADVVIAQIPSAKDLRRWIQYMNKTLDLVGPVASVYNRHPDLRRSDPLFEKFMWELRLVQERTRRIFSMIRHDIEGIKGHYIYALRRRYVRGNHRFGIGTVLTEPKRHRQWRKNKAKLTAMLRKRTKHLNGKLRPAA